ncbi:MAG: hypothetical protein CBC48_13550 [bacterium TMED88]|nr:hypothetical protein [Deltaproteobacteria bacterium]OUV28253.1 MAG: hypothetical protein CBC48_13550 [bacterium TMED88]
MSETGSAAESGPPPLRPFGLVLHRNGVWSHEGQPILNRRLRERFDQSVAYLPDEQSYIVQVGRFRGLIEVEETGFFVRAVDLVRGEVALSDGTREPLEVSTLTLSPSDGALVARVKMPLEAAGLPARFFHGPQAEFLSAVDFSARGRVGVLIAGHWQELPLGLASQLADD